MRSNIVVAVLLIGSFSISPAMHAQRLLAPGSRSVMDAHNCYPYFEWWSDRIDRALSAGTPLAIEQDLGWYTDSRTGKSWSVVTHADPPDGHEPTMEQYFFARVRPIVEKALAEGNRSDWPLITLNRISRTTSLSTLPPCWNCCASIRTGLLRRQRANRSILSSLLL